MMNKRMENESFEPVETALQSLFQTAAADPGFVAELEGQFLKAPQPISPQPVPARRSGFAIFSRSLAWGAAALALVLVLVWGITRLIPHPLPVQEPAALSPSSESSLQALDGTAWALVELQGEPLLDGTYVSLEFGQLQAEMQISGFGGCNAYGGEVRETGQGELEVGLLSLTAQGCRPEAVLEQETAYVQTLQAAAGFRRVDDRLEIQDAGGDTVLVYERLPEFAMNPQELVGTQWRLISLSGSPPVEGSSTLLAFLDASTATLVTDCGHYVLVYQAGEEGIAFTQQALAQQTLAGEACAGPAALWQQTGDITDALTWARAFRLDPDMLELDSERGETLVFAPLPPEASASLEGTPWTVAGFVERQAASPEDLPGLQFTPALPETEAIFFLEDGLLSGMVGCIQYGGSYQRQGHQVAFGDIAWDESGCPQPGAITGLGQRFLDALPGSASYQIAATQLWLETSSEVIVLTTQWTPDPSPYAATSTPLPSPGQEAEDPAGSAPLDMESSSLEIRRRILNPSWDRLWVESQSLVYPAEGNPQSQYAQAWVDRDGGGRLLSTDLLAFAPDTLISQLSPRWVWITQDGDITRYDARAGQYDQEDPDQAWYTHPLEAAGGAMDLLFPNDLALRSEDVQVVEMGTQAGRPALVVDWAHFRLWVDAETGVILREQVRAENGLVSSEHILHTVIYNPVAPEAVFDPENLDLVDFEPAPAGGGEPRLNPTAAAAEAAVETPLPNALPSTDSAVPPAEPISISILPETLTWDPGGQWLAYTTSDGQVWLHGREARDARPLAGIDVEAPAQLNLEWSPSGSQLLVYGQWGLKYPQETALWIAPVDREGAGVARAIVGPERSDPPAAQNEGRIYAANWAADGKRIAYSFQGEAWVVDLESGEHERQTFITENPLARPNASEPFDGVTEVYFSPDGLRLALNFSCNCPSPYSGTGVVEVGSGAIRLLVDGSRPVGWSPDGAEIVVQNVTGDWAGDYTYDSYRVDPVSGSLTNLTRSNPGFDPLVDGVETYRPASFQTGDLEWGPDGGYLYPVRELAASGEAWAIAEGFIARSSPEAVLVERRPTQTAWYLFPAWLPDGQIGYLEAEPGHPEPVDFTANVYTIRRVAAGEDALAEVDGYISGASWAPDGASIALIRPVELGKPENWLEILPLDR